jgi:hypothetical protein
MAGIMAMYSISGILLIYRDSDFLKKEINIEKNIAKNLSEKDLGKELKMKGFEVSRISGDNFLFKNGSYNSKTGAVKYTKNELPLILKKMTGLHKAQSKDKLSLLNVFFGISLFFFVVSSFWMFNVKSKAFKRGMVYTFAGLLLSILLIYFS